MAHSGEELMRVYIIYLFICFCSSSASFFFFLCFFFLFLLPASSSWGRLPFLAGEVGCLFWQEVGCLFLAGKVGYLFFFLQEVGCLFGRIIFPRGVDIACMCEGCSGGGVFFFFFFFLWSVMDLTKDESPHTGYTLGWCLLLPLA